MKIMKLNEMANAAQNQVISSHVADNIKKTI